MRNIISYFCLGLLLTSCGLFNKKTPDDAQETYTLKGTMYDADGITPLAGKSLNFIASGIGIQRKEIAILGSAITDENGTFEMTYNYFDRTASNGIHIDQPDEELPVFGPFLREIPMNEDVTHDVCLVPKEYFKFRIVFSEERNFDTLYIASARLPQEFGEYSYSVKNANQAVAVPFRLLKSPFESKLIVGSSDGSYSGGGLSVYSTMDRANFDLVFNGKKVPDNYKEIIKAQDYKLEIFPVVNTIEIVIE